MSLHTLAQHLQSAGRGEDKVLVHMTPNEVSGLQSLAMAHGGSLTINPETGLPEAGFLSAILPIAAGAMLGPAGAGLTIGGLSSAASAGLLVGAAGTLATGSLQKGLMMGLGAYGGAGVGAGLAGAAAGSAAPTAAAAAAPVTYAGGTPFTAALPTTAAPVAAAGVAPAAGTAFTAPTPTAPVTPTPTPPVVAPSTPAAPAAAQGAQGVESSIMNKLKTMGGNVGKLFGGSEEDKAFRDQFLKENKMPLIGAGIAALSLSREEQKMPQEQAGGYTTFNPTYNRIAQSGGQYQAGAYPSMTGERRYFADGGLADLPVARMSQQNMTGGNQNYPMAQIKPYGYAVPRNNPIAQDVIKPMDYQSVDPYTGEQKFAGGGLASLVSLATGGFVSKLKAVPKPAEIKPKLQSTAAIDKRIASLEKYSNIEEVQGRYNDLQNQIKELQEQKKNRAAESTNAAKDYNAAIAQINKDKANRLKELNTEFSNRIREIQADKGRPAKEKQAAIAEIQREQKSTLAGVNTEFADAIKNRQAEYNNFKKDYSASIKDFDTRIASLNKEATPAKSAAAFAKQYQDAVAQRDKLIATNEAATNKAREQNEAAMAKFQSYQDALAAEKQAWQEETGRKATGVQAIRPQTVTRGLGGSNAAKIAELQSQLASLPAGPMGSQNPQAAEIQKQIAALKGGATEAGYTPAYIKDPKTGKLIPSSEAEPITEFKPFTKVPGYDTTRRLMEEKDITAVFEDVAGRRPTAAEMDRFLGTQTTDAAIAQFAMNQPDVKQAVQYSDDDFRENFRYYIGRDPSSGELASMKKAKITNFNQMRNFLQQQPAYLKNLNAVAQQSFQASQKTAEDALAEQARLSASLTPEQVSTAYRDVLGRTPSMDELKQYMGAQQTSQGLEGILRGSQEYLGKLTQPLVPTPTPRYAPGTVLEYTPQQQAATGLGAIKSGVAPTPSGLQTPLTRGAVTLEGAMPLNPTFQEQLGLQTLATQAAQQAPSLQTGLKFAAPQPQNVFGFQPYAQAPQSPQSIEAMLAALRAQQAQGVTQMAEGGYAGGGYHLGDYSDGGRLLKGPGNGTSDSIPATIADKQPARLADGEFVIPARIVSELGNGSTDAGARELYSMMERIQRARRKTVGKGKVAVDAKARSLLPA